MWCHIVLSKSSMLPPFACLAYSSALNVEAMCSFQTSTRLHGVTSEQPLWEPQMQLYPYFTQEVVSLLFSDQHSCTDFSPETGSLDVLGLFRLWTTMLWDGVIKYATDTFVLDPSFVTAVIFLIRCNVTNVTVIISPYKQKNIKINSGIKNMFFPKKFIKKRNLFFLEDVVSNTGLSCYAALQSLSECRDEERWRLAPSGTMRVSRGLNPM